MKKFTSTISGLGMVKIPKKVRDALELSEGSPVYISVEDKNIVLRNHFVTTTLTARKLDEFHRIVLPSRVRQYLGVEAFFDISFELIDNKVILT